MESYVAHQMLETCGQILDGINNHPLSMTVDSFWDVLLSKPHRSFSTFCAEKPLVMCECLGYMGVNPISHHAQT